MEQFKWLIIKPFIIVKSGSTVISKGIYLLPLVLIELYFWSAYLIYRFGVWQWPFRKDLQTFIFITACNILFLLGYLVAMRRNSKASKQSKHFSPDFILLICCIFGIIMYIPTSIQFTGHILPPLVEALKDPGAQYLSMLERVGNRSEHLLVNILSIFNIFVLSIFPIAFYYRGRLNKYIYKLGIILSIAYLLIYISCSRNMPVFFFFVSTLFCYLVKLLGGKYKQASSSLIVDSVICLLVFALTVFLFSWNLSTRTRYSVDFEGQMDSLNIIENSEITGNSEIIMSYNGLVMTESQKNMAKLVWDIFPMYADLYSNAYVDPDDSVLEALPHNLRFSYVMGCAYITNGYHGMTMALHTPWEWTYGIGHADFLSNYINQLFGVDVKEQSYDHRVKKTGWLAPHHWSSGYTQLADDLSFPGVALFMLVVGYFICVLWRDALQGDDVISILLLYTCVIGLLFLPANCVLTNSGGYFINYYGLLLLWIIMKIASRKMVGR